MDKRSYRRIGEFISPIDVRNGDGGVSRLVGLTIAKQFIPSVANTNGTDLTNYKIIRKSQFACSLMQISRDGKMPVAMYPFDEPAIMSPAYPMFEVSKSDELLPEYMMMWFQRKEFDREACFYAVGGVRGSLEWEDFCNMRLPVPDIATQRKIVAEYQAVEARIAANEKLITKLEDTAQAIYKKMFVDDIDPEHLPEGWRISSIKSFCKQMTSGGTPNRGEATFWQNGSIRWLKSGEVHNNIIFDTEEFITESAVKYSSAKLIDKDSVVMAMYGATAGQVAYLDTSVTTNQACCNMTCHTKQESAYLYFFLLYSQDSIKRLANGGAQENLSQDIIGKTELLLPPQDVLEKFGFMQILDTIISYSRENKNLRNILTLLLSKQSKKRIKFKGASIDHTLQ